ncbi:hypothetical protein AB0O91_12105 [Kitasatospora sp. NPDC089797]|uniref:hypothetical protein n=1 Tax=Kitasatospora sp. NPDC089797 TaxID=3155298 RepID=UPI003440F312
MSTAPRRPDDYSTVSDPERAVKYAIRHVAGDRTEIIEGAITPRSPSWAHESVSGPHPFGEPVRLPAPFDLALDTGGL